MLDVAIGRFRPYSRGLEDSGSDDAGPADGAAAEAGAEAGPPPRLGPERFRAHACFCGVCRSIAEVCGTLDPPPLGG